MNTVAPAIAVTGLTKTFGDKKVVDNFDITVPRSALYGFLGPNGSGKTTTIRMLCGLLTADAGEGTCLGLNVRREPQKIKAAGRLHDAKVLLYEDLSHSGEPRFRRAHVSTRPSQAARADGAARAGAGRPRQAARRHAVRRLEAAVGAGRVPAARAPLLLLDEPTAGVDPKARRDFWDEIRRLSARGVTVLVSTHYMDEAVQCDYIAYIAYGKKLIDGPSADIPKQVGLETWRVEGPELAKLEDRLKREPGVEQVARFGAVLHISGTDQATLRTTVKRLEAEGTHRWTLQVAGLEEAFIYLMAGARDNFAQPARAA